MILKARQNDIGVTFTATIIDDATGAALDLTGSTVKLRFRKPSGAIAMMNGAIVNAPAGKVSAVSAAGDLDEQGVYSTQWQVTFDAANVFHSTPVQMTVERDVTI